jgi:hypothetical protein
MSVRMCMCMCVGFLIYVRMCACMYICMHVHEMFMPWLELRLYVSMQECLCIYTYLCTCVYVNYSHCMELKSQYVCVHMYFCQK